MNLQYQTILDILPLLATVLFLTGLGAYSWRHRSVPGAVPLLVLIIMSIGAISAGAAEMASTDLPTKVGWYKVRNVCMLPSAGAAICFAVDYVGLGRWLTRRNLALLGLPVLVFTLLAFDEGPRPPLWFGCWEDGRVHCELTVLAIAFLAYGIFLLLLNTALFVGLFIRSPLHRWPAAMILLGGLGPRMLTPLQALEEIRSMPLDPLTLAYGFSGLMFSVALFRFRLFNVVPVARDLLVEQRRDGLLVLDTHNRLAEMNCAAAELLGVHPEHFVGKDVAQVLRDCPTLVQTLAAPSAPGPRRPVDVEVSSGGRSCEVRISRLQSYHGWSVGRLILMHDVTAHKRALAQVLQQQQALAVLQERSRVARDLHDGVGQVVSFANMQAQSARELLARGQHATADDYLAHLVDVAQEARAGLQAGIQADLPDALRQLVRHYQEHYGIATQLAILPEGRNAAIEPDERAQLLYIVQEALTNVRKHARAQHVWVTVRTCDHELRLEIIDDGVGFAPAQHAEGGGTRFGLRYMRERALAISGGVEVESAPGKGTHVTVRMPL